MTGAWGAGDGIGDDTGGPMEATEIHETVTELQEGEEEPAPPAPPAHHHAGAGHHHEHADAQSRQWVAIFISVLAVILAITSMAGSNATKDMVNANIIASDTYAFYQSKVIRQNDYRLAADELTAIRASSLWLPGEAATLIDQRLGAYKAAIDKYESEPATGEGKTELIARARKYEAIRDHAAQQDPYFDYAEALMQIAVVLASASIVARRRWVLWLGYLFAIGGLLLLLNAYTLLVDLPL
jgi:hypothetical protein